MREVSLPTSETWGNWGLQSWGEGEIIWIVNTGSERRALVHLPQISCHFTKPERTGAMFCLVTIVSSVPGRVANCHSSDTVTRYCKVWLQVLLEKGNQGQAREKVHPGCTLLLDAGQQLSLQKSHWHREQGRNNSEMKAFCCYWPCA